MALLVCRACVQRRMDRAVQGRRERGNEPHYQRDPALSGRQQYPEHSVPKLLFRWNEDNLPRLGPMQRTVMHRSWGSALYTSTKSPLTVRTLSPC